jgi:hypothetical protein
MRSENISASWIAFKTISQSYVNLGLNTTNFVGENLKEFTKSIGNVGLNIPLGFANSIFDFLNQIMYLLVINPSGWLLLGSGFILLTFWISGITGILRVFKSGGQLFISITYGSIVFIYKIIKTPFGYIYKKEDVIAVEYTESETDAANALIKLSQGEKGGRKTRQSKKRFNKTKKNKNKSSKKTHKKKIKKTKKTRRYK